MDKLQKDALKKAGLTIKEQKLTNIAFTALIDWEEGKDTEEAKETLRNYIMNMRDWLLFEGFNLPMVVILICSAEDQRKWEEIAGDQDWHRGDFSIIVSKDKNDASKIFENILFDGVEAEDYKLQKISKEKYSEYLRKQKETLVKSKSMESYTKLLDIVANEIQKGGFDKFDDALDIWKKVVEKSLDSISVNFHQIDEENKEIDNDK